MQARVHTILFFGNERLATGLSTDAPVLRGLVAAGHTITGVVVAQKTTGPSRKARPLEIVQVAEQYGIPVIAPANLLESRDEIAAFKAEVGVLVAYGKIVPQEIIDVFSHGIINIHPSLLPAHRGPTPIESVILRGETKTGVSLMQLHKEMDAGPVYAQESIELACTETKQDLADKLVAIGARLLCEKLPGIIEQSLEPKDQDSAKASYDKKIVKESAVLQFTKTATELEREVRAHAGWPRSRCNIGLNEVVITSAHVIDVNGVAGTLFLDGAHIGMHASEGVLIFDRLIPTGKKEMAGVDFLRGYQL